MEVNISHRTRQEILTTLDIAHPDLFKNALNELLQLINMVSFFTSYPSVYLLRKYDKSRVFMSFPHMRH